LPGQAKLFSHFKTGRLLLELVHKILSWDSWGNSGIWYDICFWRTLQ